MFGRLLTQFEALGDSMYIAMTLGSFAWIEFARGDVAAARRWAVRSMVMLHALRDVASTTIALQEAVVVALDSGHPDGAAILLGAFEALCEQYGVRPPVPLQEIINTRRPSERLAEAVPPERLRSLKEQGRRMTLDEAVSFTVRMIDEMDGISPGTAQNTQ